MMKVLCKRNNVQNNISDFEFGQLFVKSFWSVFHSLQVFVDMLFSISLFFGKGDPPYGKDLPSGQIHQMRIAPKG